MATPAQVTANIANAQSSTGPRTAEGKTASSQNALKHGLTAQSVLLPGEDEAAYRTLCEENLQFWGPANAVEKELVQRLCDTTWRLKRCPRLEADAIAAGDFKTLDIISKHEARLQKIYSATYKEARELIATMVAKREALMKQAIVIRRADKLKERPTNFQAIGFGFSTQEVDAAIDFEDTLRRAAKVVSQNFVG